MVLFSVSPPGMSDEEAVLDNAEQGGLLLSKRDVSDEMIDFPSIPSICEKIYTKLGPGYSERVYHNCVEIELPDLGVPYETERIVPIVYDGHTVGNLRSRYHHQQIHRARIQSRTCKTRRERTAPDP